jgi:glycosyltransferase involved in cell wall biosynthesis
MEKHKKPLISVVTIVFNDVSTIEKTILSVICQTYKNIEYIVIDGGSTDGTVEVIKKYGEQISFWVSEPDNGIYDAMNKGIVKASGDWINFMNAGDSFYNNEVISNLFTSFDDNTDIVYGDTSLCYGWANIITAPLNISEIHKSMPFCHQSVFVRNSLMKKYKFNTHYRISADYDFFLKAYHDRYIFKYIPLCISNFDYVNGVSKNNTVLLKKETAKITGNKINYKWKYKLFINNCINLSASLIKKFISKERLQKRTLSHFARNKRVKKIELLN